jgi:hypothetical protein
MISIVSKHGFFGYILAQTLGREDKEDLADIKAIPSYLCRNTTERQLDLSEGMMGFLCEKLSSYPVVIPKQGDLLRSKLNKILMK